MHKLAEKLYKSESAGAEGGMPPNRGAPGADSADSGGDDDVIDAEFTEPREEKGNS